MKNKQKSKKQPKKQSIFALLKPYKQFIGLLVTLSIVSNALTLWLPRLLSKGIDRFILGMDVNAVVWQYGIIAFVILILTYALTIVQTVTAERVARDVRNDLTDHISKLRFEQVQSLTAAKLLTNITSDMDAVKQFVAQAIVTAVSSLFLIIGGSYLLLSINLRLGLAVLLVLPIIAATFFIILKQVRAFFLQAREAIDGLNKVINESIVGSALVRVLFTQQIEEDKFSKANAQAKEIGISILKLFSAMIPIVTFASNLAVLIILVLGGHFVINNVMSIGDFAAFNSYLAILIFPIFLLGFVGNIIAQAQASYDRIAEVLSLKVKKDGGKEVRDVKGEVVLENVSLKKGDQIILEDISLSIKPGSKTAIVGPTAAGKTQLLNVMIGLIEPKKGNVLYDRVPLKEYRREDIYRQIGFVFQDSVVFNVSIKENIAFNTSVSDEDVRMAIDTAELGAFIDGLPEGIDSVISERGTNLSGGQKQRLMLARALALKPKILLLDDFTARVDLATEQRILKNIETNYPEMTIISVTQKIASIENFDQIIVLMEGEILARGTHEQLMDTSPEYVQIYQSQQSTNSYELQTD